MPSIVELQLKKGVCREELIAHKAFNPLSAIVLFNNYSNYVRFEKKYRH